MLIQNNINLDFKLHLLLSFDDGTTKSVYVKEDDYLLLYFRYNGTKIMRACQVIKLLPVQLETDPVSWGCSMLIDCSTKFTANRLKVSSKDVLNVRVVNEDYIKALAPDYIITEDMIREGSLPAVPSEFYMIPGVSIAGVNQARYLR